MLATSLRCLNKSVLKKGNLVFETILIAVTFVVWLSCLSGDNIIVFFAWWFIFGFLQVIHAMLLGFTFSKAPAIWRLLKWYFIGVLLDLLVFFFISGSPNISAHLFSIIHFLTLWVFPIILALYLWFITWHFRRASRSEKKPISKTV